MASSSTQGTFDTESLGVGAAAGAVAWIVGYVVTYLLGSGTVSSAFSAGAQGGGTNIATWKGVGWIFFGGHFVDTEISGGGQSMSVNAIDQFGVDMDIVVYLLPVVLLVVAGYFVASRAGSLDDPVQGATVGATVAVGYFVLMVLGTFLMSASLSALGTTIEYAPKMLMAVGVAGIVYPVVLGGVGGAISAATR